MNKFKLVNIPPNSKMLIFCATEYGNEQEFRQIAVRTDIESYGLYLLLKAFGALLHEIPISWETVDFTVTDEKNNIIESWTSDMKGRKHGADS